MLLKEQPHSNVKIFNAAKVRNNYDLACHNPFK